MNDVEIKNLSKNYGQTAVLKNLNLNIRQGELITFLGPSGCGKTTTLNTIAGFIEPDDGVVYIKGKKMNGVPPYKRDLGMVFQTYSLFPHMTVYENLAFGLKLRKVNKSEIKTRVNNSLTLVKLIGLEDRYPRELSGGQRQRVAIARALVVSPELLLLDEPLSNLDAKLKHELRAEIKRLHKEVGVTTIFVTHDQEEALSLSDRIVIMNDGEIEQIGTPVEIYNNPKTEFVFRFIGKSNHLLANISKLEGNKLIITMKDEMQVALDSKNIIGEENLFKLNDQVNVYIRPEQIQINLPSDKVLNNVVIKKARIVQMNYLGSQWEVDIVTNQNELLQIVSNDLDENLKIGSEVNVQWKISDMKVTKI